MAERPSTTADHSERLAVSLSEENLAMLLATEAFVAPPAAPRPDPLNVESALALISSIQEIRAEQARLQAQQLAAPAPKAAPEPLASPVPVAEATKRPANYKVSWETPAESPTLAAMFQQAAGTGASRTKILVMAGGAVVVGIALWALLSPSPGKAKKASVATPAAALPMVAAARQAPPVTVAKAVAGVPASAAPARAVAATTTPSLQAPVAEAPAAARTVARAFTTPEASSLAAPTSIVDAPTLAVNQSVNVPFFQGQLPTGAVATAPAPAPTPAPAPAPAPAKQVQVASSLQAANLLKRVTPGYPVIAKNAHIQGTVRFSAVIGEDGRIQSLQTVSGPGVLVRAASDAVRQWVYRPTLLNGQAVEVATQIDVNFTLGP